MKTKGRWELVWVAIALAAVLTSLIVVVSRQDLDPQAQTELNSQRIALVSRMRLALAAASEEQNCAVMSTSAQASKDFIDQAAVEIDNYLLYRSELEKLVPKRVVENEVALVQRVDETFREFQSISEQLSQLALQNSNRKAYTLAFGPAMEHLQAVETELAKLAAEQESAPNSSSQENLRAIANVRLSGLRIQVFLLPHIAEPNDSKMDELEKTITAEDESVQRNLAALEAALKTSVEVEKIKSLYSEFHTIESQILKLSRENSDIRSVSISLNEKRKSILACQDALANLENAIHAEPIESAIPKGRGH